MPATTLTPRTTPARPSSTAQRSEMTPRTLRPFFALAFGICWGLASLLMLFPDQLEPIFGEIGYSNPVFIVAVWAPAIAAIWLVWRHYGVRGLADFFRRVTLWRMSMGWWALLLIGMPAVFYAGAAITGTITDPVDWGGLPLALALGLFVGPIEEFGWRGVALPLLQRRFAPFWATLILAGFWGLWHAPAFLLSGTPQSAWSFGPYFAGVVAISLILTPMFNAARGSILVAMVFHFMMNNPIWPDAQPWDNLLFAIVAAIVVFVNRRSMFSRDGAVTEVLLRPAARPQVTRQAREPHVV